MDICVLIHSLVNEIVTSQKDKLFELISAFGSPLHVLFPDIFIENIHKYMDVYKEYWISWKIFFACKANKWKSFLYACSKSNIGADVSSEYEMESALWCWIAWESISISWPVKSTNLLYLWLKHKSFIVIDSMNEFNRLLFLWADSDSKIMIRVNVSSSNISRFWIPQDSLYIVYKLLKRNNLNLYWFSFHLDGYSPEERILAIEKILFEIKTARLYWFICNCMNIWWWFTINYISESSRKFFLANKDTVEFYRNKKIHWFYPNWNAFPKEEFLKLILNWKIKDKKVSDYLIDLWIHLFIEPGRSLLDQTWITLFHIRWVNKNSTWDNIIIVDWNINHLSEQWFNTDYIPTPMLLTDKKTKQQSFLSSVWWNTCMESDMITWRKIKFNFKPQIWDILIYFNTAWYQMDSNESTFHKIPMPSKVSIFEKNKNIVWKKDENVDILDFV